MEICKVCSHGPFKESFGMIADVLLIKLLLHTLGLCVSFYGKECPLDTVNWTWCP